MSEVTTTANIVKEATNQYNQGGINQAGGYILVVFFILIMFGILWYIKKTIKDNKEHIDKINQEREEDRKDNNKLQDKLLKMFEENMRKQYDEMSEMNKNIIVEVKNISDSIKDGIAVMVENQTKSSEMIYTIIESSNDRVLEIINKNKNLTTEEFENFVKLYNRLGFLELKESIDIRIERNNLVENKEIVKEEIGQFSDKMQNEFKERCDKLSCCNNSIEIKIIKKYESIKDACVSEIFEIFNTVQEGYSKQALFRSIKNEIYKAINKFSKIDFNEI